MELNTIFATLIEILSFAMLVMGIFLSLAHTVQEMIPYYQAQCGVLAIVTALTAFEYWEDRLKVIGVAPFVIVPIFLAYFVEPLLVQATVPEDVPFWKRLMRVFDRSTLAKARQQAMPAWLRSRRAKRGPLLYLIVDLGLIALAYITAFTLSGSSANLPGLALESNNANVLAVSLSLLLIGLSIMVGTEDLISQVIGLLMMEQGMFLAVVHGVNTSLTVRGIFVVGLFLYTIITLIILVFLLPELHQRSESLDIEQQTQLKG